jgi:hypothetical protein
MPNETTGIKRAINAAWDKIPEILIASVTALAFFSFGLWIDCRDVKRDLAVVELEQDAPRLCQRISACRGPNDETDRTISDLRAQITGLREVINERGHRMGNIEQSLRDLKNGHGK